MLSSTLWRAFTTPVTYVLVFILLGTAIMQIRYVNKALQRFDSTQVIPIQFVMFTLCVILGSAVLYRDFEETTSEQAGKFVGGCLLTFFGVFLITSGRESHDMDDDGLSDDEDYEETIGLEDQEGDQQDNIKSRGGPVAQSRRGSRHSRTDYSEQTRPRSPEDQDLPTFQFTGHGTTPSSLGPESASLLGNPWSEGPTPSTPPGRGIRTLSADTLMRGSAVLSPSRSHPVTPLTDGRMPPRYPTDQPTTPQGRAHTFGASQQHHRSGTFISPSPLASTVTTVMKDGFLRGDGRQLARKSSMRHFRSRIRASLFFSEGEDGRVPGMPASEGDLTRGIPADDSAYRDVPQNYEDDQGRTRSRSLSDTLGDFFKPKRKRRKDDAGMDVEQGEDPEDGAGPSTQARGADY